MNILKSTGLKRYLAAIVGALTAFVATVPQLAFLMPILTAIAAALGGTGLIHATASKNLKGITSANIASVIAILLLICRQVPQLAMFVPILEALAALFGGAAISAGMKKYIKTGIAAQEFK